MFEILGKTNIDFMGKRTISFALSGILAFLVRPFIVRLERLLLQVKQEDGGKND